MPLKKYRKKSTKKTSKRTYKKRYYGKGKYRANNILGKGIVGLPPRMKLRMRYTLGYQPAVVASGTNNYAWSTNIADCDPVLGSNQRPLYFNQMIALYQRWFVHGMHYSIKIYNRDNDAIVKPIFCNLQVRETQSMDTNPSTAAQRWYDKDRLIGPGLTMLKGYVSTGQPYGYDKKKTWFDESYWGAGTTAPQNLTFINLMLQNPSGTAVQFYMQAEFTFYVTFMELQDIAAST